MFSSEDIRWETPDWLFEKLNKPFQFTLDAAADSQNKKCDNYFDIEQNGLDQDWAGHTVWLNPPYNKPIYPCKEDCNKKTCRDRGYHIDEYIPGQIDWIEKAYTEAQKENTTIVCLIPARTDTKLWHDYVMKANSITFLKGRLKFGDHANTAPFPSVIVVFSSDPMVATVPLNIENPKDGNDKRLGKSLILPNDSQHSNYGDIDIPF